MRSKSSSPTEASRPSAISSSRGSSHAPALLPSPPILHVRLLLLRLALPTPPAFLEGLSPPLLAVLLLDPHIMPHTQIHRDSVFEVYSMEHLTSTVDTEIGPFAFKYRNCVPDNHYLQITLLGHRQRIRWDVFCCLHSVHNCPCKI